MVDLGDSVTYDCQYDDGTVTMPCNSVTGLFDVLMSTADFVSGDFHRCELQCPANPTLPSTGGWISDYNVATKYYATTTDTFT